MRIYIVSGKAEAGKDFTSDAAISFIKSYMPFFTPMKFAFGDAIKEYAKKHYNWNGVKDVAGRDLLQYVGQLKRSEDPDFWSKRTIFNMRNSLNLKLNPIIFISDCRRIREIQAMTSAFPNDKLYTLRIERPGHISKLTEEQKRDITETELDRYEFDNILVNHGDQRYLKIVEAFFYPRIFLIKREAV